MVNPILFGDYAMADPSDPDVEDPRLYSDLGDYAKVREKMDKMLEVYNFEYSPTLWFSLQTLLSTPLRSTESSGSRKAVDY